MELQIPYSVCAEISATNNIWATESRDRKNTQRVMPMERDNDHRSRIMCEPCTHADRDSTEAECIRGDGISEREKQFANTRATWELEIQIRESKFLVQRILRRYDREEHKTNSRIYPESAKRRPDIGSNDAERVQRPVYGWPVTIPSQVADRKSALRRC